MASRPTPFSVSVAALVALHCQEGSPLYRLAANPVAARRDADSFVQSLVVLQERRSDRATAGSPSSSSSSLAPSDPRIISLFDRTVANLLKEMRDSLGNEVTSHFLAWIRVATASIDSMLDLVDAACRQSLLPAPAAAAATTTTTSSVLPLGTIDRNSQCGIYLWSVGLGFDELDFEDVAILWREFRDQAEQACQELLGRRRGKGGDDNDDDDRSDGNSESFGDAQTRPNPPQQQWFRSPDQLTDALQAVMEHGSGALTDEVRVAIESALRHHPELPVGHFAHFLASMEAGDVEAATSSLHQYLDRSIMASADGSCSVLEYAAVVVAFLHTAFGNRRMAVAATEEAIRVAQQQAPGQGPESVAYGLGWLSLLGDEGSAMGTTTGNHRAQELIQRCAERASESQLTSLSAGAHLVQSQQIARSPDHHPAQAWGPLCEALSYGAATPDDGSTTFGMDRPTRADRGVREDATLQLLGRQRLVAAGIWHALGQELMSELASRSVLQQALGSTGRIPHADVASAIQNLVRVSMVGSLEGVDALEPPVPFQKQLETSHRLDSNRCVYAAALEKLVGARVLFNLPVQGVFFHEMGILQHEWAVRRGEYRLAEAITNSLASHLAPRVPNYLVKLMDVESQIAFRLSRQGRFEEASALMERLVNQVRTCGNDVTRRGRLLLQQCRIALESNPQSFTRALEPLLESLTVADTHGMNGVHATALSLLAQVHLRMKNPVRAVGVLESAMPILLQHEHVSIQGEAYLTLAKSHLCLARRRGNPQMKPVQNSVVARRLRLALRALDRSEASFRLCEDCPRLKEVYYLQARVYDSLEDVIKRDAAATSFVNVSQHLQQADLVSSADGDGIHAEALKGLIMEPGFSYPMRRWAQELLV
jgi:Anaphase-promoting complex subunit 5